LIPQNGDRVIPFSDLSISSQILYSFNGYCAAIIFDICRWMAGCRSSSAFAHGAALIAFGISGISEPPPSAVAPQIIGIAAAIFLLVGGSRRWLGYWRLLLKCGSQSRYFRRIQATHGLLSRRRSWRQRWR
jgi:hypothetical protein